MWVVGIGSIFVLGGWGILYRFGASRITFESPVSERNQEDEWRVTQSTEGDVLPTPFTLEPVIPMEEKAESKHLTEIQVVESKTTATPHTISAFNIRQHLVSFGFEKVGRKVADIDTVVLHTSFNNQGGDRYAVDRVIDIWKSYGVAPHFLIDRAGVVHRLVSEKNIAYHAGVSAMPDGRENVNNFSLGVEILNAKDDQYTEEQYQAVSDLLAYLQETYPITHVVGHADIAPGRKSDPWNFDWGRIK